MSESLYGELVVTMFVALGDTRGKSVSLARIPCVQADAEAKLREFKELNPGVARSGLIARWTATVYL